MDYSQIKVPYISKKEIKKRAIEFRKKYSDEKIPIDIEKIIENDLGIDIIPVPGLLEQCNTDALITSDWSALYVDIRRYLDERWSNRLRFSLAHEIGHFVLHKKLYRSFGISSVSEMYTFLKDIPGDQYSFLEVQANSFAGYVLVPIEDLAKHRAKAIKLLNSKGLSEDALTDVTVLHEHISDFIASPFDVSGSVVKILLNNEFGS